MMPKVASTYNGYGKYNLSRNVQLFLCQLLTDVQFCLCPSLYFVGPGGGGFQTWTRPSSWPPAWPTTTAPGPWGFPPAPTAPRPQPPHGHPLLDSPLPPQGPPPPPPPPLPLPSWAHPRPRALARPGRAEGCPRPGAGHRAAALPSRRGCGRGAGARRICSRCVHQSMPMWAWVSAEGVGRPCKPAL